MPAKFGGLLDQISLQDVNPRPASWKPSKVSRWNLNTIRPEFLTLGPKNQKSSIRRTTWLDGLRGFAAFLVYLHHNQLWAHGNKGNTVFENGFGFEKRYYFSALPFVRLLFSGGHFAVSIFFVISGYVLSVKSLSLIQSGKTVNTAETIGSALFRRWLRLFLPIIVVTLSWMSFRHMTHIWVDLQDMKDTFREDLRTWYYTFKNYSFVFNDNVVAFCIPYHPHTWSIPIEFKGSIIIYTTLSALSRCTRNARLWCEIGLMVYFLYIADGYYGAMFIGGMFLADLDLLSENGQLPRLFTALSGFKEFIFFHLFIVALYLGGVPSIDDADLMNVMKKTPGWKWLARLKPQAVFDPKWFYLFWAALLTVASVPRLPVLKRFFETRVCQYLARVSFALYLVHGIVIWSIGERVYAAVGLKRTTHEKNLPHWVDKFPLSTKGPLGFEIAFWVPQLFLLPFTLYLAEMVTKLVDEPSVKFTNWFYRMTLAPAQTQPQLQPLHKRSYSSAC
ncbi:acyltransferase family-domain-containing protein [Phaeosphaeriaceae sp. PMI808]|nr:acyltransferase family-domain-containing protein [Phaeosphaeriaceae sp. PMI808]